VTFEELKQRPSAVWGAGPFEKIEAEIAVMHDDLVARLGPRSGEFGPAKSLYESLDPGRREELARAVADFYECHRVDGGIHQERFYLVLGTRR
jgi:hypothetical protein